VVFTAAILCSFWWEWRLYLVSPSKPATVEKQPQEKGKKQVCQWEGVRKSVVHEWRQS